MSSIPSSVDSVDAEVFERATISTRVTAGHGRRPDLQRGLDVGTALRLRSRAGGVAFAAATGSLVDRGASLAVRLAESARPVDASLAPFATKGSAPSLDRGGAGTVETGELEAWLERALEGLGRDAVQGAWVEAGRTLECILLRRGVAACRERTRVWASVTLRRDGPTGPRADRLTVAAADLASLPAWSVPVLPGRVAGPSDARALPLVLRPSAAAVFVGAALRVLHGASGPPGAIVGPGWRIADDPGHPGALVGGRFDDAAHPAGRTVLADGRRTVGGLSGPGYLRRPSFRDPPAPMASWTVLDPPPVEPGDALVVQFLRILSVGGRTWAEIEGFVRRKGRPEAAWPATHVPLDLDRWVRRCIGGEGPARTTASGVVTPSLVIDVRG